MEGENFIWSSQQLGPPGPLGELLSKASHRLFLPTPESNPHPPSSSKKHSHLINHPLDPCCLCRCLERNINTPMSCLYSCPLKLEFCPLRRGRIQTGKSKLWRMQQGPAVSCSFGSWSDPSLKLPRIVGELNTSSCHLALSLPFRLIVFAPLFCGRTERFQCLGMGHNYLKLFIALARHCSKRSLYIHPSPWAASLCCLLLFPWLRSLSALLLYSAPFSSYGEDSQGSLFFVPHLCVVHVAQGVSAFLKRKGEWRRLVQNFPLLEAGCAAWWVLIDGKVTEQLLLFCTANRRKENKLCDSCFLNHARKGRGWIQG